MQRVEVDLKPRIMVAGERTFGPGKADLLDHIARTGSISAAARAMEMSYSRAWALVDEMNRAFKTPLVETAAGGKRGGGAHVTESGKAALAAYRRMQKRLDDAAARYLPVFTPL